EILDFSDAAPASSEATPPSAAPRLAPIAALRAGSLSGAGALPRVTWISRGLVAARDRELDRVAGLALGQGPAEVALVLERLAVHGRDDVFWLDAGLLGRAAGLHVRDREPG